MISPSSCGTEQWNRIFPEHFPLYETKNGYSLKEYVCCSNCKINWMQYSIIWETHWRLVLLETDYNSPLVYQTRQCINNVNREWNLHRNRAAYSYSFKILSCLCCWRWCLLHWKQQKSEVGKWRGWAKGQFNDHREVSNSMVVNIEGTGDERMDQSVRVGYGICQRMG